MDSCKQQLVWARVPIPKGGERGESCQLGINRRGRCISPVYNYGQISVTTTNIEIFKYFGTDTQGNLVSLGSTSTAAVSTLFTTASKICSYKHQYFD